jgi:hypothetical protein
MKARASPAGGGGGPEAGAAPMGAYGVCPEAWLETEVSGTLINYR